MWGQESNDMSISSNDDSIKERSENNVEVEHHHGGAQPHALLGEPELGMTFDNENDVREYYTKYAKAKGFGVMRRGRTHKNNL